MSSKVLLSSAYLAPVSYYACLRAFDEVQLEACEHYRKQSYRNRCVVMGSNGPLCLSIPVEADNHEPVRRVRISYHTPWQHQHWNGLESAYRHSPFFDYYRDDLEPFYRYRDWEYLFDYNLALQECLLGLLGLTVSCRLTTDFWAPGQTPAATWDLRNALHPKRGLPTSLGYTAQTYYQVFEGRFGFTEGLSIVDLLFNMGPESLLILRDSLAIAPSFTPHLSV